MIQKKLTFSESIFSNISTWVEKNLKISPWEEKAYLQRAYGSWEQSFSSRGLIFGGLFNPWDEEISIPTN